METTERTTEEVISGMLKENTGSHFLDSGGTGGKNGYGRNHERNQGREFEGEKATVLSFKYSDIEIMHNVYHWLVDRLEYAPEEDAIFSEYAELEENEDKYWPQIMEEFPAYLAEKTDGGEPGGLYGEGEPYTVNTYNGEDLLSQTLQYTHFTTAHGSFILLQIHGGCDVRGGYTKPVVFTDDKYECGMYDNARATIYCTGSDPHGWSTDDAYHWYDASYNAPELSLEKLEVVDIDDTENWRWSRKEVTNPDLFEDGKETTRVEYSHKGVLVIDKENDIGFCPHCGAELEGGY